MSRDRLERPAVLRGRLRRREHRRLDRRGRRRLLHVPTRILLREFERIDEHATPSQNNPWIGREGSDTTGAGSVRSAGRERDKQAQARADAVVRPTRFTSSYTYRTIYRELVPGVPARRQPHLQAVRLRRGPAGQARDVFTPSVRGVPLPFIPFVFFGAAVQRGGLREAAAARHRRPEPQALPHLRELEHGRFYTALPTYYAPGNADNDAAEYHIGPGTCGKSRRARRPASWSSRARA
jgi:hypothetical protein